MLLSPEGQQVPDQRRPFFIVPEWTKDPFEAAEPPAEPPTQEQIAAEGGILLKEGRYLVKSVLGFSNSGGVYIGEDRETQQEVVIKERARMSTAQRIQWRSSRRSIASCRRLRPSE